jgi:hypothetical protein
MLRRGCRSTGGFAMRRVLAVLFALLLGVGLTVLGSGQASAATSGDIVFADGDLFVVHSDGTGVRQLTFTGDANDPSWSPDGQSVAYDHAGDIWVLALGHAPRRLTFNGQSFDPTWSPDGTKIAYSRAVRLTLRDIFVVPSAGGSSTRVSWMTRAGCTSAEPTWSPTGVLFYVRHSAIAQCTEGIVAQRLGSIGHVVVPDPVAKLPDVTADGTHLLFLSPCDPNFCNGNGGWETTTTGADRHEIVDRYLCAMGDLCLEGIIASPAGGWVEAATFAEEDTGFFETCFQGAHEDATGQVVTTAPQFCLSRPAFQFDVRAG